VNPLSSVRQAVIACLAALLLPATAAAGKPLVLPDSTIQESWVLSNGLRVVTLQVPQAHAISIAVGYRIGRDDDPAARPGLARLLAEVELTAPAGSIPARTREELSSVRPLGWGLSVGPHFSKLVEAASPAQFAGVLRQAAVRMRGVTVTEDGVKNALATVKRELGANTLGDVPRILQSHVRELATGHDEASILTLASGRQLDNVTVQEVREALAQSYVPANAVLAVAGDMSGIDFHLLIENEFAGLPAGTAPAPRVTHFDSVAVVLPRPEATLASSVVGLIAPAITDSLHPSFYLSMLVLGTHFSEAWSLPSDLGHAPFQYQMLEDPEFVRFYPPVTPHERNPRAPGIELSHAMDQVAAMIVTVDDYVEVTEKVLWLLGGPMTPQVKRLAQNDANSLNLVATNMVARRMWGDDAFWAEYRRRMNPHLIRSVGQWNDYVSSSRHQAQLLVVPRH
jgi:hypothetical protein